MVETLVEELMRAGLANDASSMPQPNTILEIRIILYMHMAKLQKSVLVKMDIRTLSGLQVVRS